MNVPSNVIVGAFGPPVGMGPIDQFAAHMRYRNLSPATVRRRRETLSLFARFVAPTDLELVTKVDIEDFLSTRTAARTRHAYRSDLRVFYGWLVDKDILTSSPAAKIAPVKVPKSLPRPLDVSEVLGALHVRGTSGPSHDRVGFVRRVALP